MAEQRQGGARRVLEAVLEPVDRVSLAQARREGVGKGEGVSQLALGVAVGAAEDDVVAEVEGGLFDAAHDLGDKGVGDGGHDRMKNTAVLAEHRPAIS